MALKTESCVIPSLRSVVQVGPIAPTYSTFRQNVRGFVAGRTYILSLFLTNSATNNAQFTVTMDGTNVPLFSSTNIAYNSWTQIRMSFNATQSNHTFTMAAYNTP